MKKYIILLIVVLTLSSCAEVLKPNDLKNCVVMCKDERSQINNEKHYAYYIQYINLNDSTYYSGYVYGYWTKDWNIGDTIK